MLSLADPEDHGILVNEMLQRADNLKRDHHMKQIEKLARRTYGLKIQTVQSRIIKVLENQAKDMQITVDQINSPFNTLMDNEIKDYIIYLLHLQDFHRKSLEKDREKLKASSKQVHDAYSKLCSRKRDYAKAVRSTVKKISAEKTIEMYESRLERIMHKMGTMATQNEEYGRKIHEMFIFRRQFYSAYHALQKRNIECRKMASELLDNAVLAYRSREEFMYKCEILKERFKVDIEKIRCNNVLLHRIKERDAKSEEFEEVKSRIRTDCRSTEIEGMVEKGITGLEEKLEMAKATQSLIFKVTGTSDIEDIRLQFERQENDNFNNFRYAENLNEEQDALTSQVKILRKAIQKTEDSLSNEQRNSRRQLADHQVKVIQVSEEVAEAVTKRDEVREELSQALEHLKNLNNFVVRTQEGKAEDTIDSEELDESTASEKISQWLVNIETDISQSLMLVEYLHYIQTGTEDNKEKPQAAIISLTDFADDIEEEKIARTDKDIKTQPRSLSLESLKIGVEKDVKETDHFMKLDELQEAAHHIVDSPSESEPEAIPSSTDLSEMSP